MVNLLKIHPTLSILLKKTDDFDTADFTKIDKIVRPDLYETKPIIEELDGGYKMKYLKYKNKYLKMKKNTIINDY